MFRFMGGRIRPPMKGCTGMYFVDTFSVKKIKRSKQVPEIFSFCGGMPNIPEKTPWPFCTLCERPLTFFFQIRFPSAHIWHGRNLAVFHCVECVTKESVYPILTPSELPFSHHYKAQQIPDKALENYQTNFRCVVFDSKDVCGLRNDYSPKLVFNEFVFSKFDKDIGKKTKLGGACVLPDGGCDEYPKVYMGEEMVFLMQLAENYTFPKLPNAPNQRLISNNGSRFRNELNYQFFFGLGACFFGTRNLSPSAVYIM
jgi:hypothetical protein